MKRKLVIEARRNPKINTKQQSLLGELKQIQSELGKLPNGQTNGFISFFTMHKLGIRPFPSDKTTPIGVYAYPLDYVISQFEQNKSEKLGDIVPYAGGHPVINILTIKNPDTTLFLSDPAQLTEFVGRVKRMVSKEFPSNEPILTEFEEQTARTNPYTAYQWFCRLKLKTSVQKMSSMLLNMGYSAVFDDTGRRYIAIEPTQIVFLSKSAMGHVETYVNPHSLHNGVQDDIIVGRTFHNNNAGFIKESPARVIASQIGTNNVKTFHDLVDEIHAHFEIPIVKGDYFSDKLKMMVREQLVEVLQDAPAFHHDEMENDFNIYVDRVRWSALVCANLIKLHDMGILEDEINLKYYRNLHRRILDTMVVLNGLKSTLKSNKFKNLAISESPINEKTIALADFVGSSITSDNPMKPSDFSALDSTIGFKKPNSTNNA